MINQSKIIQALIRLNKLALTWYDEHKRELPWRHSQINHPQDKNFFENSSCLEEVMATVGDYQNLPNPYHVLVSEIMLQQTTVATVIKRFTPFVAQFPTIITLAHGAQQEIMVAWQGLGYYRRAVNLHRCANVVAEKYDGVIPSTYSELLKLPGLGSYTAAAVASIAYNQPVIAFDTNVGRIITRFLGITLDCGQRKRLFVKNCEIWGREITRLGDFNQSLMDLGSRICLVKNPQCPKCPLRYDCEGYLHATISLSSAAKPKKVKPVRYTWAIVVKTIGDNQKVLLAHRTQAGILQHMMGVPLGVRGDCIKDLGGGGAQSFFDDIDSMKKSREEGLEKFDLLFGSSLVSSSHNSTKTNLAELPDSAITHHFTHFTLIVYVTTYTLAHCVVIDNDHQWVLLKDLGDFPLPTLMKKIIQAAAKL